MALFGFSLDDSQSDFAERTAGGSRPELCIKPINLNLTTRALGGEEGTQSGLESGIRRAKPESVSTVSCRIRDDDEDVSSTSLGIGIYFGDCRLNRVLLGAAAYCCEKSAQDKRQYMLHTFLHCYLYEVTCVLLASDFCAERC